MSPDVVGVVGGWAAFAVVVVMVVCLAEQGRKIWRRDQKISALMERFDEDRRTIACLNDEIRDLSVRIVEKDRTIAAQDRFLAVVEPRVKQ